MAGGGDGAARARSQAVNSTRRPAKSELFDYSRIDFIPFQLFLECNMLSHTMAI